MTTLDSPAPSLSEEEAAETAARLYGLEARAVRLVSERDQNFRLHCGDGRIFVLKISNASEDPAVIDFEIKALEHIKDLDPHLPVPRILPTRDERAADEIEHAGRLQQVRMMTFLEGTPLADASPSASLRCHLGVATARMARALQGFFHPAAGRVLLWDLKHANSLRGQLERVTNPGRRQLAGRALDCFESRVAPRLAGLRAQVVHNDLNPDNVLLDAADSSQVSGIIDFGDMVHAPLVADLAVALAYQLFGQPDPVSAAADIVRGYHSLNPLEELELSLLLDLVTTRLAMSGIISSWRSSEHPENRDYILSHEAQTWPTLETLMHLDRESALGALREACGLGSGLPASTVSVPTAITSDDLRRRREHCLAPGLGLSYEQPLELVRGKGVWLYDAQGRAFLDAYNNVAHVGHAHPKVSAAISGQARLLNTNTRYLHRHIVDYAERLADTFPDPLGVCMFVCSGSEANDLAWRMARSVSGNSGVLVTENAYHGNTSAVMQFSPEELPAGKSESWVATVPAPNQYSGNLRGDDAPLAGRCADLVDQALTQLEARGHRAAAFFFDSIFTSDGIHLAPSGYLQAISKRVRDAGGVCIADEVQAGFGRTGNTLWCFERYGFRPDIVTLGKPMGNGHPMAAVVTSAEIAAAFSRMEHYFNTFGGNPVSCAAGLALLDVLEAERLQEQAAAVGEHLRKGLESLKAAHSVIGDVRGSGLFFGVELVDDRVARTPASEKASHVLNAMRQHGVLIGRTGNRGQVLKIRPPMVFSLDNAERLVATLETVLRAL